MKEKTGSGLTAASHVNQLFDLSGRIAIITGGSLGLGRQMAQGLAEAGAHLVLCARKVERCQATADQLQRLGVRALALGCDVTQPNAVQAVVDAALREFGRIDILINSAGISWGSPPEEMSLSDWTKVLNTNLTGTFLCAQAVGKVMIAQRRGSIINIASVAGLHGAPTEIVQAPAYHASKGGVIALTKDLACKWGVHNVRVNAIAPGWFPTHMSQWTIEHHKEELLKRIPLGRFGNEFDLKGVAVFLASDASSFTTGQVVVVDGGQSA